MSGLTQVPPNTSRYSTTSSPRSKASGAFRAASPVNTARSARKCRRHISPATWSSVAAFISRARSFLVYEHADSPRIRSTLARVVYLKRDGL
jgi:hypothetical protein